MPVFGETAAAATIFKEGYLQMTMLTHGFNGPAESIESRGPTKGAAEAHLSALKRFCLIVLTILSAGGLLAGAIALKTAIYFWGHNL
jgi:hypothetical protein